MTKPAEIAIALFVLLQLFVAAFCGTYIARKITDERQQNEATEVATEHGRTPPIDATNPMLVPSSFLTWRTPTSSGLSPLLALGNTSRQMQYEQGTDLGSDANARALILVMEAVAILEGRDKTVDGIKVIE